MIYGIGDIVKVKDGKNKMEYYMVVDVFLDFKDNHNSASFRVDEENTRYTAMQIYPIEKEDFMLLRHNTSQLDLVALVGQEQHRVIMELVRKERKRQGKTGTPFYEETIKKRVNQNNFDKFVSDTQTRTWTGTKGKKKKIEIPDDVIQYDKLMSVDECLDAMNDLASLHKQFGDESYLQLREVVVNRLRDLTDIIKKAKSFNKN